MAKTRYEGGGSGRPVPPPSEGEPYQQQHPLDVSFVIQSMNEVREKVGILIERTDTLKQEVIAVRTDVKGMVGTGAFWTGIGVAVGVIVTVAIGLGAAYWMAISTRFDSMSARFDTLDKVRQPIIIQAPQPQTSTQLPTQQNQGAGRP